MTATTRSLASSPLTSALAGWRGPVTILAGLAAIVVARLWATRAGLDALAVGAAFGLALLALVAVGAQARTRGLRPAPSPGVRPIAIGVAVGLALVAVTVAGPALVDSIRVPGLGRPAAPFVPWALITILVAIAEEAVLRGVLFDRVARAGGLLAAVVVTTVAFALLHVPLYGWGVVPLDLAVGLVFGGLRIATGSIAAPAAAHAVADLATWWL